jgi:hypothetical protein
VTDLHTACVGCLEVIPMTPGQVVQVGLIVLGLLLAFAAVALASARYNR